MFKRISAITRRVDLLLLGLSGVLSFILLSQFSLGEGGIMVEASADAPARAAVAAAPQAEEKTAPKSAARAGAPVRFLMYNVQNYFVDGDVSRSRYSKKMKPVAEREQVATTIASASPEVVGLIEIGGTAALDDLAARLASRGLHYPHRTVLTRWGEDRALALLSMHPIVADHSKADCSLLGQTNRRMLRGILDVTVRTAKDKREFRIIGAHLKSRVGDNPAAAEALRAREARTLAAHVQQAMRTQPNLPILVYGDWNDGPADPALAVMTQGSTKARTLRRLKPEDSRGESWTIYYKEGDEYSTFDQIYVNSVLSSRMGRKAQMGIVENEPGKRTSDHRAVWCEMY